MRFVWYSPQHNSNFFFWFEVIQVGDDIPTIHLCLVKSVRTVIKTSRITQPQSIRSSKYAEVWVGVNDFVLVGHGKAPLLLEYLLNHKHHIRASRIVLIKNESHRAL